MWHAADSFSLGNGHKTQVSRRAGAVRGATETPRELPSGNLHHALLNKALKHYPKLKDIHTLPEKLTSPRSLSEHSRRCGLVSMATVGLLSQVRSE